MQIRLITDRLMILGSFMTLLGTGLIMLSIIDADAAEDGAEVFGSFAAGLIVTAGVIVGVLGLVTVLAAAFLRGPEIDRLNLRLQQVHIANHLQ